MNQTMQSSLGRKGVAFAAVLTLVLLALAVLLVLAPPPSAAVASEQQERAMPAASAAPVPLPRGCGGVSPPETPVCCMFGYIYHDGAPVGDVTVQIESRQGTRVVTTASGFESTHPYYVVDLSSAPLLISAGEVITITASYGGMRSARTWTVQSGGQQVDLGLVDGYEMGMLAPDMRPMVPGWLDYGAAGMQAASDETHWADDFEAATIDPVWTLTEQYGTITVTTEQAQSGSQAVKFSSTSGGQREIHLNRSFSAPVTGTASIWLYDSAPGSQTLYVRFELMLSSVGVAAVHIQDYDGNYYHAHANGVAPGQVASRSLGWHLLEIDTANGTVRIDGSEVITSAGSFSFDSIDLNVTGPGWRPNATYYFDDLRVDSAPGVQFDSSAYTVEEGAGVAVITATLSDTSTHAITIDYATGDGTATAGSDYTTATGTLTFTSGMDLITFTVPITNDVQDELDETVDLALSDSANAVLGTLVTATLTIVDDDEPDFVDTSAVLTDVYGGGAWGDYDNDGDLDILLVGCDAATIFCSATIYRNDGGAFSDIHAGLGEGAKDAAWGDYDGDNDLDLLLIGGEPTCTLKVYRNDDGDTFTDIDAGLPDNTGSIAWGDYDNDGDLDVLMASNTGASHVTEIYRNDGGDTFTDINAGLIGVRGGSVAWGDYDNDSDLDILLTGWTGSSAIARVYRNDGGTFVDINAGLIGAYMSDAVWGDYDNDGDLDILRTGSTGSSTQTRLYRNNGDGTFTDISTSLTVVEYSDVAWGDYDNDGDLDVLLSGWSYSGLKTEIHRNDGGGTFTHINAGLTGVREGSVAWGDYDNDGDLDILLTGGTGSAVISRIYRNDSAVSNTVPSAPTSLSFSVDGITVTLGWSASNDAQTPSDGLTYNLRVGTTPGGSQTVSPMASTSTGYRRVAALGEANHGLTATLILSPGTYYWSVQAVDAAFAGSPFASEGSFTIGGGPVAPSDVEVDSPTAGLVGTLVTVTATVTPPTATLPLTYVWEAAGQSPVVHTGGDLDDLVSFTWSTAGTYYFTVTVSNAAGVISKTMSITIAEYAAPSAAFTALPLSGTVPLDVQFTDESTGEAVSWDWVFGDGGVSGARHPEYEYVVTGTYTVSLTVTGPGGTDTETKTDYISVLPPTTWTLMLYFAADNNLHTHLEDAIDEMERVAYKDNVNILVLWDGAQTGDTRLYHVQYDLGSGISSPIVSATWNPGELGMDDSLSLANFVNWSRSTYPADHYLLSIANHGRGTSGIAWDDTSPVTENYLLAYSELRTAISSATSGGSDKIDVLFLDACLMGLIEDAYEVKDYVDYAVASENLGWSVFAYDDYVASIGNDTTPEELATSIADAYFSALHGYPGTVAALDMAAIGDVGNATDALAQALITYMDISNISRVLAIRNKVQTFDSRDYLTLDSSDEYIDLYDFAKWAKSDISDTAVQNAAQGVMDAINACVVAEHHQTGIDPWSGNTWDLDDAHGIAIYSPPSSGGWDYSNYVAGGSWVFCVETEWDEFLVAYFSMSGLPPETPEDPRMPPMQGVDRIFLPLVVRQE